MSEELRQFLITAHLYPEQIAERIASIRTQQLARSAYTTVPDFRTIHPFDVALLFDAYDAAFFQGELRKAIGEVPLNFSLSKRMTKAGGRTRRVQDRTGKVLSYGSPSPPPSSSTASRRSTTGPSPYVGFRAVIAWRPCSGSWSTRSPT